MSRLAAFLAGIVVMLVLDAALAILLIWRGALPIGAAPVAEAVAPASDDVPTTGGWQIREFSDAISGQKDIVLFAAADTLGIGDMFGFRCEMVGAELMYAMAARLAAGFGPTFGQKSQVETRVGGIVADGPWVGIGDGAMLSAPNKEPSELNDLEEADSIGLQATDNLSGQPRQMQFTAKGAVALRPIFEQKCRDLAASTIARPQASPARG